MRELSIDAPCSLAERLRSLRIPLKMSCGGHGSCKTCRVLLDGEPVLACQTDIQPGQYELKVPQSAASSADIQIDLSHSEAALDCQQPRWSQQTLHAPSADDAPYRSNRQRLEAGLPASVSLAPDFFANAPSSAIEGELLVDRFDHQLLGLSSYQGARYAIAVDIGTTTLAAALIDLPRAAVVACQGRLNGQYAYAEDLVARISFCHTPELLQEMQSLGLRQSLAPLLRKLLKAAKVERHQVLVTVLSGNAPMIHILLGLDPSGMGGWPFNGVDFAPPPRPASSLGLPGRQLEIVPAQSAYLGGDIVSGLAYLDFENAPDGTLFVDLGTNAEMALKADGKLLCTAVPAGPSFEGGGFPCGISAIPGAIDRVWNDGPNLALSTIGDLPPIGLCGSGIISFIAAAYRARLLRKKGRFAKRDPRIETRELLGESHQVYPFSDDVYVSEDDISNFLQAKAAVFSGILTLCKLAGLDPSQIDRLYLAGNFGKRVEAQDLVDIGILPPIDTAKIEACGNTSLKGAIFAATDRIASQRAASLARNLDFVELNAQDSFQDDFINALFIPHLKLEFPDPRIPRAVARQPSNLENHGQLPAPS